MISDFLLKFQLCNPAWPQIEGYMPVVEKLNFKSVTNISVKEGSYTPENDYLYLWQSIPEGLRPNFIFFLGEKACLSAQGNNVLIHNAVPVHKVFLSLLNSASEVENIYLEGRTNVPVPMDQGLVVPYFFLAAQVTV